MVNELPLLSPAVGNFLPPNVRDQKIPENHLDSHKSMGIPRGGSKPFQRYFGDGNVKILLSQAQALEGPLFILHAWATTRQPSQPKSN